MTTLERNHFLIANIFKLHEYDDDDDDDDDDDELFLWYGWPEKGV